jgi:transcriptional regulator with XRE-family HTH domain
MTTLIIRWNERKAIEWALDEDGMSATALANQIGMDPSKLSRIISGEQKKLPIEELTAIARAQSRPLAYYTELPEVETVSAHNPRSVDVGWFPRPIDFQVDTATLVAAA